SARMVVMSEQVPAREPEPTHGYLAPTAAAPTYRPPVARDANRPSANICSENIALVRRNERVGPLETGPRFVLPSPGSDSSLPRRNRLSIGETKRPRGGGPTHVAPVTTHRGRVGSFGSVECTATRADAPSK